MASKDLDSELHRHQTFPIPIRLQNLGRVSLENYRLDMTFDGADSVRPIFPGWHMIGGDLFERNNEKEDLSYKGGVMSFEPVDGKMLVTKDSRTFKIAITPSVEATHVDIHWRLYAKEYHEEGDLKIYVDPQYVDLPDVQVTYAHLLPKGACLIDNLPALTKRIKELTAELQNKAK